MIFLLDVGRRSEFATFAKQVGAIHMTRPDNNHAKAGNINHALTKTKGEFIAIFDCDHIPTRSFLQLTLGTLLSDSRMALVQTPHHFFSPDPFDPPRFEALARLRTGDGANTAVYAGLYSAELQRAAYPDIEPVDLDVPVQRAYEVALGVITKRKWLIIDERAPQPPRRIGRIEAVARTPIMGFREDVTIRVSPDGDGSRIDIRSSSRYFEGDFGSNATRVARLIEDITSAAESNPRPKTPVAESRARRSTAARPSCSCPISPGRRPLPPRRARRYRGAARHIAKALSPSCDGEAKNIYAPTAAATSAAKSDTSFSMPSPSW
eukprot:gene4051-5535_t